jgi:type II secretory pathway component PulC
MRITLLALLLAGCATTGKPDPEKPLLDERTETREAAADAPVAPPVAAPKPAELASAKLPPGVIARTDLNQFLDAAPGSFLQHVESEPRFRAGRFQGWKVTAFFPGDARFAGVDLRAGDVVTRVNGSSIERPEQLMQVWEALRTSKELVVDVERAGAPRTLRWSIAP